MKNKGILDFIGAQAAKVNKLRPANVANMAVQGAVKAKAKYDTAWKNWQNSPRYKEGVRRAKNEG